MLVPKLLTTLRDYDRHQLGRDVTAGVIVGIVALPLAPCATDSAVVAAMANAPVGLTMGPVPVLSLVPPPQLVAEYSRSAATARVQMAGMLRTRPSSV